MVTAYVLASTITTPLYGKLGDLYGRKRLLMVAIVIFLIGSALSGLSQSMDQLIAFRALQGLGAGGLMVGAIATIGDLVSPRERGQYMGYMMGAMMLAMIAGPLVGGYITDALSWQLDLLHQHADRRRRAGLPVADPAPAAAPGRAQDRLPRARRCWPWPPPRIVLLTTWGGSQYAWGSPQILAPGARSRCWPPGRSCAVEARAAEPILPLHVFRNRNFALATAMCFLLGLTMFGALTFLPLYQQTVQHASATGSGLLLIPLMLGSTVTSLIAGPGDDPDRPLQGPADHRRRDHVGRPVPAVPPRPGHLDAGLRQLLRGARASAWASSCRSPR